VISRIIETSEGMKDMYDAEQAAAEEFSALSDTRQWALCMEVLIRDEKHLELSQSVVNQVQALWTSKPLYAHTFYRVSAYHCLTTCNPQFSTEKSEVIIGRR